LINKIYSPSAIQQQQNSLVISPCIVEQLIFLPNEEQQVPPSNENQQVPLMNEQPKEQEQCSQRIARSNKKRKAAPQTTGRGKIRLQE
jgi:hypothetical protein